MKRVTKKEMIDVIEDWIECIEESNRQADGSVHDPKIVREVEVLKAIRRVIHTEVEG